MGRRDELTSWQRFAAVPLDQPGTSVEEWRSAVTGLPAMETDGWGGIVAVVAHPDDEVLGMGQALAVAAERGIPVQVLIASAGEGAFPDTDDAKRRTLAQTRRYESRRAATRLGLPPGILPVPDIKLIIPTVFADEGEVGLLRAVLPGARLIICELAAPVGILKQRVTAREPTDDMAAGLRRWVDVYHARSDHGRIRHFQVQTHPATVDESVQSILQLAGWALPG